MAYTPATLDCLIPRVGAGPALWLYSTTDTTSGTVDVDGYFSDGADRGLVAGDAMIIIGATGGTVTTRTHYVESTTAVRAAVTQD
jgi:xanthine/uracil/vitamin C permease (AzgA family)